MSSRGTPTASAVSPDSGRHWTDEGAWPAAPGVHRIPLPLPSDGLRAVNVYALEVADGLVLVDGGWAIPAARDQLDRSLRSIGAGFGDIRRFLVTHVHRDHYTMARVLGRELGVDVALGRGEEPSFDLLLDADAAAPAPFTRALTRAGAADLAAEWARSREESDAVDRAMWQRPDTWLDDEQTIALDGPGRGSRTLAAVHTPGHTPGHLVFADRDAGLLFAGDHVLPTITPSIGFTVPQSDLPLGDFLTSLARVRALPDLALLPAHGPVAGSTHARVDALVRHHEVRLDGCLRALDAGHGAASGAASGRTAVDVARDLPWTRHETRYDDLDAFNRGLAALETRAHLDLLVARGTATVSLDPDAALDAVLRYARPG